MFAPLEFGVTVNFSIILYTFSCALSSYAFVTEPSIDSPLAMKSFAYKHDCYCVCACQKQPLCATTFSDLGDVFVIDLQSAEARVGLSL